jgi:hypothetical protein
MVSAILQLVQMNLDPNGELVENKPPTKTRVDGKGYAREELYDPKKPNPPTPEREVADENDGFGGFGDD